ncbi:MAG: response regulator transcription factor [bacterium]
MLKILIAEDNARMRKMLRRILARHLPNRVQFYECEDGECAVSMANEHQPDWILMDIKMPEKDGFLASREILQNRPEARIIFVSNFNDPAYQDKAQRMGIYRYVLKDNLFELLNFFK